MDTEINEANERSSALDLEHLNRSPDISLSGALLIFYTGVASKFTHTLFSKQVQHFLEHNRFAQHLIAFILLLVTMILIGGVTKIDRAILYSAVGYAWFILSTKLDAHWNIMILLTILIAFLYEIQLNEQDKLTLKDPVLSKDKKDEIIIRNSNYKTYFIYTVLGLTVIGSGLYLRKKILQYDGNFDLMTFLFY